MYEAKGTDILVVCLNGDRDVVASAPDPAIARKAAEIMTRAARENSKSHYTASARLYYKAELLGITWKENQS